ncbi:hypothetical protein DVH24_035065 [Malus domestica]|uniref:Uncharacterized protein n=1 Tax=Malus domestica TaxID=3750 RepID=A0A498IHK2_MALDO|nr:hypothetical protein DVH24_035065 [Malus domestica]
MSYLATLHTLLIWNCEQLDLENGNYQLIPLRLRRFSIAAAPRMVALPEWLQGAANTLRVLCIWDCENLDALPEWLTSFTSLRILHLSECPKLVSLPEGMHPLEIPGSATAHQALAEWAASPEVPNWFIEHADRMQLIPSESSDEA